MINEINFNPEVLILCVGDSTRDPRVVRQEAELRNFFSVQILDTSNLSFDKKCARVGISWRLRQFKLMAKNFSLAKHDNYKVFPEAFQLWDLIFKCKPKYIICNDLPLLGCALAHKREFGTRLIFDAHEYYPGQSNDILHRLIYHKNYVKLCKRIAREVDYSFTVCDGIRDLYEKNFQIKRMRVIWNCSKWFDITPKPVEKGKPIRFVHHGIASPNRKIENMIEVFEKLGSNFQLDLVLVVTKIKYFQSLTKRIEKLDNVKIIAPVEFNSIVPMLANYDMGIFLLPANTDNHRLALPNKFFEFIQARLGLVIWPSQEMMSLVERYKVGIVSEEMDVESVVSSIRSLTTNDIMRFKKASHFASKELCAENSWLELTRVIKRLNKVSLNKYE